MEVNILYNSFTENLKTKIYGKNLKLFESIESTNKKMLEDLNNIKDLNDLNNNENLTEGTVYIALKQTAGKGSYENSWQSNNDLGLWLSVLLYSPFKKEILTFLPCIALTKLLKEKYNIKAHIKWPNDVLVNHKKISGTLIQITSIKDRKVCIIGTGINLYHNESDFISDIKNKATSLFLETGIKVKIEEFYKEFIYYFEEIYFGEKKLTELFRENSEMIGKKIKAKKDGNEIYAIVKDITEEGYLKVEINNEINIKEETWISRASLDIDTFY